MNFRPRTLLVSGTVAVAAIVSIGGGATFVALEVTTDPEFCNTCHTMEPYYESWAASSHSHVACTDCHYEPGILETFEGKFKALSQLAKYVTRTEGSKPWAEVSDYSCMRSGCHSTRLIEGEIRFGRIRFDHRHHLIGLRRGKKLRCTSCHSQIVQGNHLTVTTSSCILCHFKQSEGTEPVDDCNLCHGPPSEEIQLGDFVFRHADYLDRGVPCASCHGDVTRGTGDVPRERCGSCHNKQEHLERIDDVEFMHSNHVTDHSVSCLDCHLEIQHGLPSREEHFQGDCTGCHEAPHGVSSDVFRGTGGQGVADRAGVMFLARVTCQGCHRPPFPGAPVPVGGATFAADPLACMDCHGTGYEGMADLWQAEVRGSVAEVQEYLGVLHDALPAAGDLADEARGHYEAAAGNLGLVLLDRSDGVHNLPYVRDLLGAAARSIDAGLRAVGSDEAGREIQIGPRAETETGCTDLCHVAPEALAVDSAFELPFSHSTHLLGAGLDCSACHEGDDPHAGPAARRDDCTACHHANDDADLCGSCHEPVAELRMASVEGLDPVPMQDLECVDCHMGLAYGHSARSMEQACFLCHDEGQVDYAAFIESGEAPLRALEQRLPGAAAELSEEARQQIAALRRAGPFHNPARTRAVAEALQARLTEGVEEP